MRIALGYSNLIIAQHRKTIPKHSQIPKFQSSCDLRALCLVSGTTEARSSSG